MAGIRMDDEWVIQGVKEVGLEIEESIEGNDLDEVLEGEAAIYWSQKIEAHNMGWERRSDGVYLIPLDTLKATTQSRIDGIAAAVSGLTQGQLVLQS